MQVRLSSQPEYGMGYQYCAAMLSSGKCETGYILNCQIFATKDELTSLKPQLIEQAMIESSRSNLSITSYTLIERRKESLKNTIRITSTPLSNREKLARAMKMIETSAANEAAKNAPTSLTFEGEIFMRFSPYFQDRRITPKKGLQPGTFATTEEDGLTVRTGSEAVSRYALENKQSANKRFTITPLTHTSLQRGTVQPAYGESGGGVEVIFVNGTQDGTVTGPTELPE